MNLQNRKIGFKTKIFKSYCGYWQRR